MPKNAKKKKNLIYNEKYKPTKTDPQLTHIRISSQGINTWYNKDTNKNCRKSRWIKITKYEIEIQWMGLRIYHCNISISELEDMMKAATQTKVQSKNSVKLEEHWLAMGILQVT